MAVASSDQPLAAVEKRLLVQTGARQSGRAREVGECGSREETTGLVTKPIISPSAGAVAIESSFALAAVGRGAFVKASNGRAKTTHVSPFDVQARNQLHRMAMCSAQ